MITEATEEMTEETIEKLTTEQRTAKLLAMQVLAQEHEEKMNDFSRKSFGKKQSLQSLVWEYQMKRVELFKQMCREREMVWCTKCGALVPQNEAKFLFTQEGKMESHGYENSFYDFQKSSKLYQACTTCSEKIMTRHGWVGKFDSQTKKTPFFHTFTAEKREDGWYILKFGEWEKIKGKEYKIEDPPDSLIKLMETEWNLPSGMELSYRNGEVILHIEDQSS